MTRRLLSLATVAAGLSWALSTAGCARDRYYSASPGSGAGGLGRVAPRPPLDRPDVKPMFVGGYAGSDYNRASRPAPMRNRPMTFDE